MLSPPTAIDLFAGAGGATQGLKDAGFSVLAAVESDHAAAESYEVNHPEVVVRDELIQEVDPDELRASLEIDRGTLTLLKACPPCQGYSSLGSGDPSDPRNDLVGEVTKFVAAFEPAVVLLENVPGLATDRRLAELLEADGLRPYRSRHYVINATDFGVPQRRRRLIVIALHPDLDAAPPASVLDLLPEGFAVLPAVVDDALRLAGPLGGDDVLHVDRPRSQKVAARIRAVPLDGGDRFGLPPEHRLACHDRLEGRNATTAYGRIRAGQPAPTMTTRCTTPACGRFIHPTEPRAITLREAALIQTFPPTYSFRGGPGQVERQIGNAVPVRMAEGLGRCVLALMGHVHATT